MSRIGLVCDEEILLQSHLCNNKVTNAGFKEERRHASKPKQLSPRILAKTKGVKNYGHRSPSSKKYIGSKLISSKNASPVVKSVKSVKKISKTSKMLDKPSIKMKNIRDYFENRQKVTNDAPDPVSANLKVDDNDVITVTAKENVRVKIDAFEAMMSSNRGVRQSRTPGKKVKRIGKSSTKDKDR